MQFFAEYVPNSQMCEKRSIFDYFSPLTAADLGGEHPPTGQIRLGGVPGAWRMAHGRSQVRHPGHGHSPGRNRRPRHDFRPVSGLDAAVAAENAARGTRCVRIAGLGPRPAIFGCRWSRYSLGDARPPACCARAVSMRPGGWRVAVPRWCIPVAVAFRAEIVVRHHVGARHRVLCRDRHYF